jgi:transcriptional regulator with XRE-family HTH domain
MNSAMVLRQARRRAKLTLRVLADRAGTSHATLAAYESGTKVPRVDTLTRILHAAGFESDIALRTRADVNRARRGRELAAALDLASRFPARRADRLRYPDLTQVFT